MTQQMSSHIIEFHIRKCVCRNHAFKITSRKHGGRQYLLLSSSLRNRLIRNNVKEINLLQLTFSKTFFDSSMSFLQLMFTK